MHWIAIVYPIVCVVAGFLFGYRISRQTTWSGVQLILTELCKNGVEAAVVVVKERK